MRRLVGKLFQEKVWERKEKYDTELLSIRLVAVTLVLRNRQSAYHVKRAFSPGLKHRRIRGGGGLTAPMKKISLGAHRCELLILGFKVQVPMQSLTGVVFSVLRNSTSAIMRGDFASSPWYFLHYYLTSQISES